MNAKPTYMSKTIILNVLAAVVVAAEANFHLLQPLLPVNVYSVISFTLVILNVALREITDKPLQGIADIAAPPKPRTQSKTHKFNILSGLLSAIVPGGGEAASAAIALGNVALRFFTKGPVG